MDIPASSHVSEARPRTESSSPTARLTVWVGGLLLASGLPLQLAGFLSTTAAVCAGIATTALLALLWAFTFRGASLAPARRPLSVFALLSGYGWVSALVTAIPAVSAWLETAPIALAFLLVNGLKLVSVVPLAVVCRRWTSTEMYPRFGDMRAPVGLPGPFRGVRWSVAGPVFMVLVLALFLTSLTAHELAGLPGVLPWLPLFLLGALVNGVAEEFLYRHAAVGALRDTMTVPSAVVLTSLVFGLAHVTGNPGGLFGVLYTAAFGLVCAVAMVRTGGFGWNLAFHIVGDMGVLLVLSLSSG